MNKEFSILKQHIKGSVKTLIKKHNFIIDNKNRNQLIKILSEGIYNQQFCNCLNNIQSSKILQNEIDEKNKTIEFLKNRIHYLKQLIP